VLPEDAVIVAHFYDIESGRKDLSTRGRGSAREQFPHPHPPRRRNPAPRRSRTTRPPIRLRHLRGDRPHRPAHHTGTDIEHRLERAGVRLLAADEPFQLTPAGDTGYMVWNRKARKGDGKNHLNPVSEWIWSPEPVHEALVDLETFILVQAISAHRFGSRSASGPNTKRSYIFRTYIFCEL
jgi:hypothetical protein